MFSGCEPVHVTAVGADCMWSFASDGGCRELDEAWLIGNPQHLPAPRCSRCMGERRTEYLGSAGLTLEPLAALPALQRSCGDGGLGAGVLQPCAALCANVTWNTYLREFTVKRSINHGSIT